MQLSGAPSEAHRIRPALLSGRSSSENLTPARGGGDCLRSCASRLEPTGGRRGPVHDCAGVRHSEDSLHSCATKRVSCSGQLLAREGHDPVHSVYAQHHAPFADTVHPQTAGYRKAVRNWSGEAELRDRPDPLRGLPEPPAHSPVLNIGRSAVVALAEDRPPHTRRVANLAMDKPNKRTGRVLPRDVPRNCVGRLRGNALSCHAAGGRSGVQDHSTGPGIIEPNE